MKVEYFDAGEEPKCAEGGGGDPRYSCVSFIESDLAWNKNSEPRGAPYRKFHFTLFTACAYRREVMAFWRARSTSTIAAARAALERAIFEREAVNNDELAATNIDPLDWCLPKYRTDKGLAH